MNQNKKKQQEMQGLRQHGGGAYDLSKLKGQTQQAQQAEEVELYPSELNELKVVAAELQRKYGWKPMSEGVRESFTQEVEDRFAAVGLVARVTWDIDVSGTSDTSLFHIPSISVVGRVDREEETDHERMAREIQSGEADGKVGTVRGDGTFGDSKRKLI